MFFGVSFNEGWKDFFFLMPGPDDCIYCVVRVMVMVSDFGGGGGWVLAEMPVGIGKTREPR